VFRVDDIAGRKLLDCGWRIVESAEWKMTGLQTGKPLKVIGRIFSHGDLEINISVDGGDPSVFLTGQTETMEEVELSSLEEVNGGGMDILLEIINYRKGDKFYLYHVWVIQPGG
jgi:hypothetical protein